MKNVIVLLLVLLALGTAIYVTRYYPNEPITHAERYMLKELQKEDLKHFPLGEYDVKIEQISVEEEVLVVELTANKGVLGINFKKPLKFSEIQITRSNDIVGTFKDMLYTQIKLHNFYK